MTILSKNTSKTSPLNRRYLDYAPRNSFGTWCAISEKLTL